MTHQPVRLNFPGGAGATLAARLDLPAGQVRAYALFAHCFTCSKDLRAARRIAEGLAVQGIAVLRFDFTGLGASEGEFASTNFSSNVEDLLRAADFLREHHAAPAILIGHSLGGAAVLSAAGRIPEVRAVATLGAPYDAAHVIRSFGEHLGTIEADGEGEVSLAGRTFTIRRQFVEDLREQTQAEKIRTLRKPLMVLHAPFDNVVGIENAGFIFQAAKHPKSFVSLDGADHLLSREQDAAYAAAVIAAWASRYLEPVPPPSGDEPDSLRVSETGAGKFQNTVSIRGHRFFADEPESVGGFDSGPNPYDFLSASLAACTSMTLRVYAEFKKLDVGPISVTVRHDKVAAEHCRDCGEVAEGRPGKIDRFERVISVEGGVGADLEQKLLEIADKCPVHRTLHASAAVVTRFEE